MFTIIIIIIIIIIINRADARAGQRTLPRYYSPTNRGSTRGGACGERGQQWWSLWCWWEASGGLDGAEDLGTATDRTINRLPLRLSSRATRPLLSQSGKPPLLPPTAPQGHCCHSLSPRRSTTTRLRVSSEEGFVVLLWHQLCWAVLLTPSPSAWLCQCCCR